MGSLKRKWNAKIKKTIPVLFIYNLVIDFIFLIPNIITNTMSYRFYIKTITSCFEIFNQLILFMFTEDFIFNYPFRFLFT